MTRSANECLGITDITELFYHVRRSYRTIARLFHSGARMTTKQMCRAISMSEGTVLETVNHMRQARLIHVAGWTKSELHATLLVPIYQLGNSPDVPKPAPKDTTAASRSKEHRQRIKDQEQEQSRYAWHGLAQALVPSRNEQEQHQVNRLYLNWISEGTYG
jgi:hypothetical protein